ncbi:MAG: hypothetical protein ACNA71_10685, partial [Kiritimatiellia bacterium]
DAFEYVCRQAVCQVEGNVLNDGVGVEVGDVTAGAPLTLRWWRDDRNVIPVGARFEPGRGRAFGLGWDVFGAAYGPRWSVAFPGLALGSV